MNQYSDILKEELLTALGCTEPIAIALLAARFADALEEEPLAISIKCSGNIIKNVKSVTVPNTGGLKGIEVAVLAGVISKNWQASLEVLNAFSDADRARLHELLKRDIVKVEHLQSPAVLHITIEGKSKHNTVFAELIHSHTNIVKVVKNGAVLQLENYSMADCVASKIDRACLNIKDILHFADTVDLDSVSDILTHQETLNSRIFREGFQALPEKSIAKTLQRAATQMSIDHLPITKAKIALVAAIEARMLGMSFPVVTNSGSGTQGLCVSIPVLIFAEEEAVSEEKKLRSLIVSNLISNHQKTGIGKLSAYCGAVSATTAAMAGIAYMKGYGYDTICRIISNSLATISGMVCDGAKVSCATKAATGLETAFLAYTMAVEGVSFAEGDGIVKGDIEKTICAVGDLAAQGMRETDTVLLKIMLEQ